MRLNSFLSQIPFFMNAKDLLLVFGLCLCLCNSLGKENISSFSHSVETERKPWTDKQFLNDPNEFQFAIVADRTGGVREGIFPEAVGKLNELRPEFVITVGDMIKGGAGNRDVKKLMGQWKEFNSFIKGFDMPFFYLPGNHDLGNEVADQIWDDMFGVRYYSFVYENVLFLCLNTQGGPGSKPALLEDEQIQWALAELRKNLNVRWTFVFMHQPLWLMEEGILIRDKGKKILRKTETGWPKVAEALQGRQHTVLAGHVHHLQLLLPVARLHILNELPRMPGAMPLPQGFPITLDFKFVCCKMKRKMARNLSVVQSLITSVHADIGNVTI